MYKLFTVIIVALALRLVAVSYVPPSLNWDEVSLGYNAYSLLKSGRDEWGQVLPTIFRAYGDYKLPGYIYASVPVIGLLGLNPLSVRLTSIISGTLLVVLVYLLARRLRLPAGISALLVAISPWSLFLSRVAVEANLGILMFTLGATLLVYRRRSLGILFLVLSCWSYNSFRVFVPLFFLGIVVLKKFKFSVIHYSLFVILFSPIAIQLLQTSGLARYQWLQILDSGAIAKIGQLQSTTGNRLLYNKATYFVYQFAKNYALHFTPSFLFLNGGTHYQFSIPSHGILYAVSLPLFYLGIYFLLRHSSLDLRHFVFLWIFLSPIPDSLTRDAPHALRTITMMPAAILAIAAGLSGLRKYFKFLPYLFIGLLVFSFEFYVREKVLPYRANYSWAWQYGYTEVVRYVKDHYWEYDEIIVTKRFGEPHEYFAFYWPWDPADFQKSRVWDYHDNWYWTNSLDKITFVNDWEMPGLVMPGKKYLLVSSPDHPLPGIELSRIDFLNSSQAFILKSL